MSRFIQLHVLTSYPPSNLNRDDTGSPKTAIVGDCTRLRISSQSLKRAWRTSDIFAASLKGNVGTRTKEIGVTVYEDLLKKGISEKNAREWARTIAGCFGKLKAEKKPEKKDTDKAADKKETDKKVNKNEDLHVEQLVHFSPEELAAISALVAQLAENKAAPEKGDLELLRKDSTAVDIAMFGRMLASTPVFNTEAAVQVAHAITVHKAAVEDDYFIAVDDLNNGETDAGAAHIGELGFGAGVFYLYICIDKEQLAKNLGGDDALVAKALSGLLHAVTKVSPTGKQNSFASRAYAGYVLAEKGDQQPRSLAQAFLAPVKGQNILNSAVKELDGRRKNFEAIYGACADESKVLDVEAGTGSLAEVIDFVVA